MHAEPSDGARNGLQGTDSGEDWISYLLKKIGGALARAQSVRGAYGRGDRQALNGVKTNAALDSHNIRCT